MAEPAGVGAMALSQAVKHVIDCLGSYSKLGHLGSHLSTQITKLTAFLCLIEKKLPIACKGLHFTKDM